MEPSLRSPEMRELINKVAAWPHDLGFLHLADVETIANTLHVHRSRPKSSPAKGVYRDNGSSLSHAGRDASHPLDDTRRHFVPFQLPMQLVEQVRPRLQCATVARPSRKLYACR